MPLHVRLEEKGMTEHEMVGWQHQLNGHEFEQTPGHGCCSPWDHKESDMTAQLNNSNEMLGVMTLTLHPLHRKFALETSVRRPCSRLGTALDHKWGLGQIIFSLGFRSFSVK